MVEFVRHECGKCMVSWEAAMFYELGGWFYSPRQVEGFEAEERAYCPHCGEEGTLIEGSGRPEKEADWCGTTPTSINSE